MKHKKLTTQAVRRLIFILITVLSHIIQFTWLPMLKIPFPIFLMIPLLVCISMHEREFTGMFMGLLTGALWDLASPVTDGFLALLFTVFGCLCGLLCHYILRSTLLTAIVLTSCGSAVFSFINILFSCMSNGFDAVAAILLKIYLPAFIFTVILTFPVYFFVKRITGRLRTEKRPDTIKR